MIHPEPTTESKTHPAPRSQRFLSTMDERRAALQRSLAPIASSSTDLVCEFGSGHGHFLVAYAQANPSAVCVGVDIDPDRVARAHRKQARAKLGHLHFLQADAGLFLDVLPAGIVFSRVFILFPDPWPKKRHHKHRLIQTAFLHELRRRATDHTRVYFRTDHAHYFESAQAVFAQHPAWQLVDEPWPFEHETVFQSRAESYRSLVAQPRPPAS
jgi:tRNA (guanine-N7-)-methyltransferase